MELPRRSLTVAALIHSCLRRPARCPARQEPLRSSRPEIITADNSLGDLSRGLNLTVNQKSPANKVQRRRRRALLIRQMPNRTDNNTTAFRLQRQKWAGKKAPGLHFGDRSIIPAAQSIDSLSPGRELSGLFGFPVLSD